MGKELTDRQKEVLDFICERIENQELPPTIREIGENFKITSTNGVRAILSALSKKGYIRRKPLVSRGIELVKKAKSRTPHIKSDISATRLSQRDPGGFPPHPREWLSIVVYRVFG